MTAIRDRILAEARLCLGLGGPEPWGTEAGVRGGASKGTSWCGLFVRAIWRRAGLEVKDWAIGDANLRGLARTSNPAPGDLIMWRGKSGHQSLFVRTDGGAIVVSLDGNTEGTDRAGKRSFSTVAERRSPMADVLAFYEAPVAGATQRPVPAAARTDTGAGLNGDPAATPDTARGLDVSAHQDPAAIDWKRAAALGYRYGIVRLTNGVDLDERAREHARRIRDAGMALGSYGFFVPWRAPERLVSAFTAAAELCQYGRPGDLIPWLDVESWQGASGHHRAAPDWSDPAERTLELLAQAFGGAALYCNVSDWAAMGSPSWIGRYPLAAAHYTDAPEPLTAGRLRWTWWQHRVAPIAGVATVALDQSVCRLPMPTIQPRESEDPRPHDPQRVDVGWIPVGFDRDEHNRLRNAAIERDTAAGRHG